MEVHNWVPYPQPGTFVGRQHELEQGLQTLRKQRYTELRGSAGEGKTMLARHLVTRMCQEWEKLPGDVAKGNRSYAVEVDVRVVVGSRSLRSALAVKVLAMVGKPASEADWQLLLSWLRRQAHVLVVLENAEAALQPEAHRGDFTATLRELHALQNVHLVLPTRVPGPAIVGVSNGVVQLRELLEEDALQLLKAHLPQQRAWGADGKDQGTARKLVRLVEGNPLVLGVAGGLYSSNSNLSWQDMFNSTHCDEKAAVRPAFGVGPGMDKHTALLSHWLRRFLDEDSQQLLAAVAVFGSSFTAAGAAAVVGCREVGCQLRRLVSASLMEQRPMHVSSSRQAGWQEQRYSLHAVVKQAAVAMAAAGQHSGKAHAARGGCRPWWMPIFARSANPGMDVERAYAHWMVLHKEGPGQVLQRCAPAGPEPDMNRQLHLLDNELLNFSTLAAGLGSTTQLDTGVLAAAAHVGRLLNTNGHGLVATRLLERVHMLSEKWLGLCGS